MPAPDLLLLNARIATVDAAESEAEAMAVFGGRVVALGTTAEMRALKGSGTRVLDAEGRRVIPGVVDSHAHPDAYAVRLRTWTLVSPDRVRSREELSDVLAQMVGELSALHMFVYGGDVRTPGSTVGFGWLGGQRFDQLFGLVEHGQLR